MRFAEDTPFYRVLATKHDTRREAEAIAILELHPEIALLEWPASDTNDEPFVAGSTALHYAANDGRLDLAKRLVDRGANVNASSARWFRSVLSWAANNARVKMIQFLLEHGASADSLDALHAAAWGGSERGKGKEIEYSKALELLIHAGANLDDRRHRNGLTPLAVALESGNQGAIDTLRSFGAKQS